MLKEEREAQTMTLTLPDQPFPLVTVFSSHQMTLCISPNCVMPCLPSWPSYILFLVLECSSLLLFSQQSPTYFSGLRHFPSISPFHILPNPPKVSVSVPAKCRYNILISALDTLFLPLGYELHEDKGLVWFALFTATSQAQPSAQPTHVSACKVIVDIGWLVERTEIGQGWQEHNWWPFSFVRIFMWLPLSITLKMCLLLGE